MAITPAMREKDSGMVRFSKNTQEQYFDVAIAEQHTSDTSNRYGDCGW